MNSIMVFFFVIEDLGKKVWIFFFCACVVVAVNASFCFAIQKVDN